DGPISAQRTGPYWKEGYSGWFSYSPGPAEFTAELCLKDENLSGSAGHIIKAKVGGKPDWLEGPSSPPGGPWQLLLQLVDLSGFTLGVGDCGLVYAMINSDATNGFVLWQT